MSRTLRVSVSSIIISIALLASFSMPLFANAETTPATVPGSFVNDSSNGGTASWGPPTEVSRVWNSDDVYLASSLNSNASTNYLVARGFNFSIPSDATITGIEVAVERHTNASVADNGVFLGDATGVRGNDQSSPNAWPNTDATITYGSDGDTWGGDWTPSEVNASDFALYFSARNLAGNFPTVFVDQITVTVHYLLPGTISVHREIVNNNGGTADTDTFGGQVGISDGNNNYSIDADTATPLPTSAYYIAGGPSDPAYTPPEDNYTRTYGGDCDENGYFDLQLGQNLTCTITYDDVQPDLTLTLNLVNDNGGTAQPIDFTLYATGPVSFNVDGNGGNPGSDFAAGTYTLSANAPAGYALSAWSCEAGGPFTPQGELIGDQLTLQLSEYSVCTITADDTAATPPSTTGKIAFWSNRDGNNEIYVMNADGGNPVNVSANAASDEYPAFSYDGSKIAFNSNRDGNNEIYVMNADGSNQTRITTDPGSDFEPTWAPDGTKLAFTSLRDGNYEIYVINADGTGEVNITNTPGAHEPQPTWSPDGTKIAFTYPGNGANDIYVMNADGSGARTNLTNDPSNDSEPSWSHDGTKIAFASTRSGFSEIYTMNADGSSATRVATAIIGDNVPTWSPDGVSVAFNSIRAGGQQDEIVAVNTDGTGFVNLTNNPASDVQPSWGPTYVAPQTGTLIINKVVVNLAGSAVPTDFAPFFVDGYGASDPAPLDVPITLPAGDHFVQETQGTVYTPAFSGDCDVFGHVMIEAGITKTCVITNTEFDTQLTVIVHVENQFGGTAVASDFKIGVAGLAAYIVTGSETGETVTVVPGSFYNATPNVIAGGYEVTSSSADCFAIIGADEHRTCTITFSQIPPPTGTLTVIKNAVGGNGTFNFGLYANGINTDDFAITTSGSTGSFQYTRPAGTYAFIEESLPAGWVQTGQACVSSIGDTENPSALDLDIGETITCTITNEQAPIISGETAPPAQATSDSVTITWTTDHPATSRVIYDTISHAALGTAPNYGYANSTTEDSTLVTNHSVTVTGLTPGVTYYFRSVSHGSPEAVGAEVSATPGYVFGGFQQPINAPGHDGIGASVFKAGSTVPVKFQLKNGDGSVTTASTMPIWLTPQKGAAMNLPVDETVYTDPATSGTAYQLNDGTYQYKWSTKGLQAGYWYKIFAKLDDGKVYSIVVGLK